MHTHVPAGIGQSMSRNKESNNGDREFRADATRASAIAKENGMDLAIKQSRSPSCGVKERDEGTTSGARISGQGVSAKMLMDEGIRVLEAGARPRIIPKNEDGKRNQTDRQRQRRHTAAIRQKGTGRRDQRTDTGAASARQSAGPGIRPAVYQPAQSSLHRWTD